MSVLSNNNEDLVAPEKYRYDRGQIRQVVKDLSQVSWLQSCLALFVQWAVIVLAALAAIYSENIFVYFLAIFVIATRQHALGILVHDAVHYRLFENRTLNDLVSDFFCAHGLGTSTALYRTFHFNHHRFTNTPQDPEVIALKNDPDWQFPMSKKKISVLFLKDLTGLNFLNSIRIALPMSPALNFFKDESKGGISNRERIAYVTFLVVWFGAITLLGWWKWYLIFWILPAGMTSAIFRLRMMAEHHGVPNDCEINGTRSVLSNALERLVMAPLHVNYHLEHHMFPTVPFFNLKKLHSHLVQDPEFFKKAHLTKTYIGFKGSVLSELRSNS